MISYEALVDEFIVKSLFYDSEILDVMSIIFSSS